MFCEVGWLAVFGGLHEVVPGVGVALVWGIIRDGWGRCFCGVGLDGLGGPRRLAGGFYE